MLHINDKEIKTNTFSDIIYSKTYIQEYFRIYNPLFTYMTVVGDMTQYGSHINSHFDSGDIITALFHVVDNTIKGGFITFFDGLN